MWTKTRRKYQNPYFYRNRIKLLSYLVVICIVTLQCECVTFEDIQKQVNITECEAIGFKGAKKNACGYCVEGDTNLPKDYGTDCKGVCGGPTKLDCNVDCGGTAYIDECTGECVGGNTGKIEDDTKRDCSHACFGLTPFRKDNYCKHCAIGGQSSPFQDCANNCYKPNEYQKMAKYVCDQCVGGKTEITESEVKDMCGNCKKDQIPCLCNGTENVDICGICGGKNNSCFKIVKFQPDVIPSDIQIKITITGAFMGKNDISCLFKSLENNIEEKIIGIIEDNSIKCDVKLSIGNYQVGVNISEQREPLYADKNLIVYDHNNIEITSMNPVRIPYNDDAKKVTVNFEGNNFPDSPITCFIKGKDWPKYLQKISGEKYKCDILLPKMSQNVTIIPSFNGIHKLNQEFTLSFISPQLQFSQGTSLSEDKTAIIITFDRPVDVCNLKTCIDILSEETLEKLDANVQCNWPTKQQLVIKMSNPVQGSRFQVSFKSGVLKEDNQKVAEYKTDSLTIDVDVKPQSQTSPVLIISGPKTVPKCGTFSLIGHFSNPGEQCYYTWDVWRSDRQYVNSKLSEIIRNTETATLTLNIEGLDFDVDYTFQLTATTESRKISATKSHTLRKMNYDSPIVTVISNPTPSLPIEPNKEVILNALITVPECIRKLDYVYMLWSVDNPKLKFDFGSITSPVYRIKPNTLPGDTTITFTAKAFIGSTINETSESSVTFRIAQFKLKAIIEGNSVRTVGTENGVIELDGSKSGKDIQFIWSCEDENQQPCYDYSESKHELLITKQKLNRSIIRFPSNALKAGQKLKFGLKVQNADMNSEISNVIINVINGSIPEIILKSVVSAGVVISKSDSDPEVYFVPAGASVIVCAIILSNKNKLSSVQWNIIGSTRPFTYSVLEGKSCLSLGEGYLIEHGVYRIEMKACDDKKYCGNMTISLYATPHVSSCKITFKEYTACKWTTAKVHGCVVSPDRLPLTYQVIMYLGNSYIPVTVPEFTDNLTFIGPSSPTNDDTVLLGLLVCDKFNKCKNFSSDPVPVINATDYGESLNAIENSAKFVSDGGDSLKALCMFLCFSFNNETIFTKDQINGLVKYTTDSIAKFPTVSQISSQISALQTCILPICSRKENSYKTKCLNAIEKSTEKASSLKAYLDTSIISQSHEMIINHLNSTTADIKLLQASKNAQLALLMHASSFMPLGDKLQFGNGKNGTPFSMLYHKYLDKNPLVLRSNVDTGKMLSSVSFGKKVMEKFTNWDCGEEVHCNGVVVSMSLYPNNDPFMLNNDKQLSPVIDIRLLTPGSGKEIKVQNVENDIRIKLALKIDKNTNKDIDFYCYTWDENKGKWSSDNVQTIGSESNIMQCWTSHLSSFVVLETNKGLSTATIAGIVVAALMAVFIICVVVLFFVRKKQSKQIKVSTEALRRSENEK